MTWVLLSVRRSSRSNSRNLLIINDDRARHTAIPALITVHVTLLSTRSAPVSDVLIGCVQMMSLLVMLCSISDITYYNKTISEPNVSRTLLQY